MGAWGKPSDWWRSSKSISGGILYDWGVHLIEYALQVIDDDITEVNGFSCNGVWTDKTVWKGDTNEDESTAIVRFKKGAHLTLRITSIDTNLKPAWFEITGTNGSYIFNWDSWELIVPKRNTIVRTKGKNPADQYWQYYTNIADHLVNNAPLVITPEWSRRPIHILDLANRSARLGRTLKAKYK
jgi:scyllo-inositol 2-dehydrogenase (NADP+)